MRPVQCQRCHEYFGAGYYGRKPSYCADCRVKVTRETAARRKREQRARQKENEVGKPSADPVVLGFSNHTPTRSSSQVPTQKTTRQPSATPLYLGQRDSAGSFDLGEYKLDWEALVKRVDRIAGPFGFLYL